MNVLALDLSTKTGWAVLSGELSDTILPRIVSSGVVKNDRTVLEYCEYPWCYLAAAEDMARKVSVIMGMVVPDIVVIEEINLGRNRYTQKELDFIHCCVLKEIEALNRRISSHIKVVYISSSAWRSALKMEMSREQKKNNAKLSKAKRQAAASGERLNKKRLGIAGKITKKHVAINWVNEVFGTKFKMKDNDEVDAISLGAAYLIGAIICDGT